ncbi:MAG: hypothetical protein ACR2MN_06550 [Acidimicrobiales bacterium]
MEMLSRAEAMRRAEVTPERLYRLVAGRVIGVDQVASRQVYREDDIDWLRAVPVVDRRSGPLALVVRMDAPSWLEETELTDTSETRGLPGAPTLWRRVAGWEWGMTALEEERACTAWWPEDVAAPVPTGTPLVATLGGLVVAHWVIDGPADEVQMERTTPTGGRWAQRRVRYAVRPPEELDRFGVGRVVDAEQDPSLARWVATERGLLVEVIGR